MQPDKPDVVRIGTRASALAQAQSRWVQAHVAEALGAAPERADQVAPLVLITTSGDRMQDRRLLEIGGKQLFTKEIEDALLDGRIDLAVHSLKDVPAMLPDGLGIAAMPQREDPRDALISNRYASLDALPQGARIGTASLRRQAQLKARRPDLQIAMLRGNVDTRLKRLDAGDFDAIILAQAGLNRLGLGDRAREAFDPIAMPPAPGQGALALQTRETDGAPIWLSRLHHRPTEIVLAAERGALYALEASCKTAMGAYAYIEGDAIKMVVEALTADGQTRWRREGQAPVTADAVHDAHALGVTLGAQVRVAAGDQLIIA